MGNPFQGIDPYYYGLPTPKKGKKGHHHHKRRRHHHKKLGHIVRILRVRAFSPRRLGAPLARELYEDLDPPPIPGASETAGASDGQGAGERDPGSGRPTKADRRAMQRFKGIDG